MKEAEMKRVGAWILEVLSAVDNTATIDRVRNEIREFCKNFPVPGIG
jgi:glycine hydroxymethyltransferase